MSIRVPIQPVGGSATGSSGVSTNAVAVALVASMAFFRIDALASFA